MVRYTFEYLADANAGTTSVNFVRDRLNTPLHLSLRAKDGVIVLSSKREGAWGAEHRAPLKSGNGHTYVLDLELNEYDVSLAVDALPVLQVRLDEPVTVDCKLRTVLPVTVAYVAAADTLKDPVAPMQEPRAVFLGGESFTFHDIAVEDSEFITGTLGTFLATQVLTPADGVLLDMSRTAGAAGCVLQAHFPRGMVAIVLPESEHARARANLARNGISGPILVTEADASAALGSAIVPYRVAEGARVPVVMDGQLGQLDVAPVEIGTLLGTRPLAAIIGRDLFQPGAPCLSTLQTFLKKSAAAICSVERSLDKAMSFNLLQGPQRDIKINFLDSPWTLRRNRLGASTPLEDRLDIGVAMYNTGAYIVPCIESLLADDRNDVRVVLVDDGSTDDSLHHVTAAFGDHPRLTVVTKPNGGCASARNYARVISDAAYIAFVDADDFVDPKMFPALLDLARVSGNEIVQGGFCFHEDGTGEQRQSYEVNQFKDWIRMPFRGQTCFRAQAELLIPGQPTIWRRVYRRDFLDNKNLWFPEHIRAFDDMIFHQMSVYLARDVLTVDGLQYYYRQHAAQDIKQGDERHFYELEMYRMLAKRAVREGWNNFHLFVPSLVNTINWSLNSIRDDLVQPFIQGAAELWVMLERAFGQGTIRTSAIAQVRHADFTPAVEMRRRRFASSNIGFGAVYLDAMLMHPSTLIMGRRLASPLAAT
ncbi:glycosyltransferase [Falsiroseomonas sp. E2-1-a20]|uniref:glycosyltransferase n=1 Tax=Falsiroseomonas sp. E2-1-a20 TaxID=3239300 RepID=UPI003F316855